jgi:hypothetical protein
MQFRPFFMVVPAVIALAAGLAWLTSATAIDGGSDTPQIAQAAPPPAAPPAADGGTERARPQRTFSPQTMCKERVARRIGYRAYLKARLELKPEQMALWTTFEKAADEASAKNMARCSTLPTDMKVRLSITERMTMQEDMMKARLASLEAVKPSLLALYAALTPDQKAVFDRPMGEPGRHRWRGQTHR